MFLIKNWKQTPGVISGREQQMPEDENSWQYRVTYTADGTEYRSVLDTGNDRLYDIGQQVTVAYAPDKPQKCMDAAKQKLAGAGQIAKLVVLAAVVLIVLWVKWLFS